MNNVNLAGYLVGIGIHHKDGTETYKKLDKPIHNRIVKTGINQMLMYNGTSTGGAYYEYINDSYYSGYDPTYYAPSNLWYPLFRGNLNEHYGCLHFCQYGTDNTPTKFFQTALNAPYSDYTETIKPNEPYTCTYSDDWNQVSIYITHQHEPVTETVTVREIGWFGRCTRETITEYLMFSRVALDEPITLQEGEYLFNTYRLICTVDPEPKDIEDFGGISGQHAYARYCPYFTAIHAYIEDYENAEFYNNNNYYKRGTFGFPGILKNGRTYYPIRNTSIRWDSSYTHTPRYFMFPQVYFKYGAAGTYSREANGTNTNSVGSNSFENVSLGLNENTVFPEYNDARQSDNLPTDTTINTNRKNENAYHTFVDYDTNKNYRDIKLTLPKYNPDLNFVNNETLTIHYLRARGYDYKLGYYTWNADHTEQTWKPQPIVKKVNEQIDFYVRTTITTDDTEAWQNGEIVEGQE